MCSGLPRPCRPGLSAVYLRECACISAVKTYPSGEAAVLVFSVSLCGPELRDGSYGFPTQYVALSYGVYTCSSPMLLCSFLPVQDLWFQLVVSLAVCSIVEFCISLQFIKFVLSKEWPLSAWFHADHTDRVPPLRARCDLHSIFLQSWCVRGRVSRSSALALLLVSGHPRT